MVTMLYQRFDIAGRIAVIVYLISTLHLYCDITVATCCRITGCRDVDDMKRPYIKTIFNSTRNHLNFIGYVRLCESGYLYMIKH